MPPWGYAKGSPEILTSPIIGPSIYNFWMPSFNFWVFAILNFTQNKQLFFFGSRPCWAHFGRFGAITPVNNVRESWNFDHRDSSLLYKCHLNNFENLKFLQRQDVPKIWAFRPTLTPIYPLKMAKIKNSHWLTRSIKIISFLFSVKIIISLCTVWAFFGYKRVQGQRSRCHSSG